MANVSIKEVARIARVSIATVSRSINYPEKVSERTRIKVQDAIARTGYLPNRLAQNFRRGRTNMVLVVLPTIGDPFFSGVIDGIRKAAVAQGYSIIIDETQANTMTDDEIGAMLVSRQTDGIILLASMSPYGTEILSAKSNRALPIVIGCEMISPELSDFPCVHIDNVAAAAEATHYLIGLGHRRIAMIYGLQSSLLTKDREVGFRNALRDAGLPIDESLIVEGKLTLDGTREATRSLLDRADRPTAVFCANDEMAMGCLHEIKAAGLKIPDDISVVGFDDVRYAAITDPPLTTISQPTQEIGERVMNRLCEEIENGPRRSSGTELLPHRLVIRQSAGPPPEQQR